MHANRHGLLHTIPTCPIWPWTKVEEKNIFLKSRYFSTGCPNSSFSVQNGLCRVFRNLMCRPERIWSLPNCCRRSPHIPWTKVEKKTFHHTNRYFWEGFYKWIYIHRIWVDLGQNIAFLGIGHHLSTITLFRRPSQHCWRHVTFLVMKNSPFSRGNGPFFSCR